MFCRRNSLLIGPPRFGSQFTLILNNLFLLLVK